MRFLDQQIAKIQVLIENKQTMKDSLQESMLAQVVSLLSRGTRGTPTKACSLGWLNEVPETWEIAPLYARYEVKLGKMLDQKRITGTSLGPYLRNVNVQWDYTRVDALPEMDFTPREREELRLTPGDLLVCEGGEVGRTAMWRGELEECYFQKAVHRLRPLSVRDIPRFFFWVMFAAAKLGHFRAGGNPNTIDHLTGEQLRRHRFPFPPADVQREIAQELDQRKERIQQTLQGIDSALARLNEYRAALITAAVIGHLDIPEAA